jgi:hypothetical protein
MTAIEQTLTELTEQLRVLQAESAARRLLGRYMFLCDAPMPTHEMSERERAQAIGELFTEDAVWEGVGAAHSARFGRKVGPHAIADHMAEFFTASPKLTFNTHYLCSECLTATQSAAEGTWVQFQPWVHDDGRSVLRSSRLHVAFRLTAQGWRIARYRTENLFIADLPADWASSLITTSVLMETALPGV